MGADKLSQSIKALYSELNTLVVHMSTGNPEFVTANFLV
jgi:hypothetical protein